MLPKYFYLGNLLNAGLLMNFFLKAIAKKGY